MVLYSDFWRVSLSLSATLLFAMSIGLLVSVCSRNAFRATAVTIMLMAWLAFAMPLLGEALRRFPGWSILTTAARWVSPFYAQFMAYSVNGRFGSQTFWDALGAITGWSIVAIAITCLLVPHSWRERGSSEIRWRRWFRDLRAGQIGTRAVRRKFRQRLLDKNPFAWLAARGTVSSTGFLATAALLVVGTAWMGGIVFRRILSPNVEDQLFLWSMAGIVLHCLVMGKASTSASERFAEDLQSGGLELLLCTPLSISELLRGQRQAWRRQLIGVALITLMVHAVVIYLFLTQFSSVNNAGPSISYLLRASAQNAITVAPNSPWEQTAIIVFLFAGAAVVVLHWVTLNWTSAWLSLRLRQPRFAPWVAVALVAIPPWLAFLGCIIGMLETQAAWPAARVAFFNLKLALALHVCNDVLLIGWARRHLLRDFRAAAARLYAPRHSLTFYLRPAAGVAVCITLLWLFHWEENRRGKRAWDALTAELTQRGERLERVPLSFRRVPADQNFASVPLVADIFSRPRYLRGSALGKVPTVTNQCVPLSAISLYLNGQQRGLLPWNEESSWAHQKRTDLNRWLLEAQALGVLSTNPGPQTTSSVMLSALLPFAASLEALREGSAKPDCLYPLGNASDWNMFPPHLETLANVSEVLRYRASAGLLEGEMEQAFADVNLCLYLAESLGKEPAWRSHAARAQLIASALQPIWEGLADHCWPEPYLIQFQERLGDIDVLSSHPFMMHDAMLNQIQGWSHLRADHARKGVLRSLGRTFSPEGWTYLNQVSVYRVYQTYLTGLIDPAAERIDPRRIDVASSKLRNQLSATRGLDFFLGR